MPSFTQVIKSSVPSKERNGFPLSESSYSYDGIFVAVVCSKSLPLPLWSIHLLTTSLPPLYVVLTPKSLLSHTLGLRFDMNSSSMNEKLCEKQSRVNVSLTCINLSLYNSFSRSTDILSGLSITSLFP